MGVFVEGAAGGGAAKGQYAWNKLDSEGGAFVDYVVSNNENKYPNSGEQGGYWYELVVEGFDLSLIECSKFAVDKFTLSSNQYLHNGYNISHSLGVKPKFAFLFAGSNFTVSSNQYVYDAVIWCGATATAFLNTNINSNNGTTPIGPSGSAESVVATASAINMKISSRYLKSGIEYTLVTLA